MDEHTPPIMINVIVSGDNNKPCIHLRRKTNDEALIKLLVQCAFYEQPLIMIPKFRDKFNSLASLTKQGILHKDKEGQYHFNI